MFVARFVSMSRAVQVEPNNYNKSQHNALAFFYHQYCNNNYSLSCYNIIGNSVAVFKGRLHVMQFSKRGFSPATHFFLSPKANIILMI